MHIPKAFKLTFLNENEPITFNHQQPNAISKNNYNTIMVINKENQSDANQMLLQKIITIQ